MGSSASVRGRPADASIERRVLTAALTVYGEVGWAGFTIDAVARRAPVGKAALYRRWPSKEDLLLAALDRLAEVPEEPINPNDLGACLTGIADAVIAMYVGPKAMVLPRVLIEAGQYPPHFDEMVQKIVQARFTWGRCIVAAALDRGELPPGTSPDLIVDAIMGGVLRLIVLTPGTQRAAIHADREKHAAAIADSVLQAVSR
jgi:AcrR family transcriptional regulator